MGYAPLFGPTLVGLENYTVFPTYSYLKKTFHYLGTLWAPSKNFSKKSPLTPPVSSHTLPSKVENYVCLDID